ncbi:MAG: cytidylate kinase-like family protein [Lachnospiraceae bacterium]|nr:cytidylate kinase-like family protein [Lachnospiraceae bacterium]
MNIITISREFGSGGRELGKYLADLLGYDYYDREIVAAIAGQKSLDEKYVEKALENHIWQTVPLTFRQSFAGVNRMQEMQTGLLLEQTRVIEGIAKAGKNCVIVGRNADVLLAGEKPFSIFVCAGMEAKIQRCMERAPEGENLSRREMEQNIRRIDKNRARTRELLGGSRWGSSSAYHLMINTTEWNIKELAPAVAEFADCWFRR